MRSSCFAQPPRRLLGRRKIVREMNNNNSPLRRNSNYRPRPARVHGAYHAAQVTGLVGATQFVTTFSYRLDVPNANLRVGVSYSAHPLKRRIRRIHCRRRAVGLLGGMPGEHSRSLFKSTARDPIGGAIFEMFVHVRNGQRPTKGVRRAGFFGLATP